MLDRLPVAAGVRDLLGREPTLSERWLEHPQLSDPFWAPLQCGAALERITVPVLVVGGWQDLFIEQNLEQYRALAARGVPTRLLVGPWAHLDITTKGAAAIVESMAWLDRYAAPGKARGNGSEARGNGSGAGRSSGPLGAHLGRRPGRGGVARDLRLAAARHYAAALAPRRARLAQHPRAVPGSPGRQLPLRPGRPHAVAGRRDPGRDRRQP